MVEYSLDGHDNVTVAGIRLWWSYRTFTHVTVFVTDEFGNYGLSDIVFFTIEYRSLSLSNCSAVAVSACQSPPSQLLALFSLGGDAAERHSKNEESSISMHSVSASAFSSW